MTSQNRVATFNLRDTRPMLPQDINKRMPGGFRIGREATIDKDPCPHCGAQVEWAPTSSMVKGSVVRYIYARCRAHPHEHAWGFRKHEPKTGAGAPIIVSHTPEVITTWIDSRLKEIEAELSRLTKIRELASGLK